VETVTGADKSLDFDLNIYLLRLMLATSAGCAEEDKQLHFPWRQTLL